MASFSPRTTTERRSVEKRIFTPSYVEIGSVKYVRHKKGKTYTLSDDNPRFAPPPVAGTRTNVIASKLANFRSYISKTRSDPAKQIHNYNDVVVKLLSVLCHLERERFVAIFSDEEGKVLGQMWVEDGETNSVQISARDLFAKALHLKAYGLFVAHNHPSGNAEPSRRDIKDTRLMTKLAADLGIILLDHIVIGRDRVVSMRKRGII